MKNEGDGEECNNNDNDKLVLKGIFSNRKRKVEVK